MALNLSTLTNSATSGDVLAEALTTADFLEPTPVLRNLARGSNKGGDAKQGTALNQPKALPLIKNPSGDLGGYLYIPDVAGNYAEGPSVTIGSNETWEAEVDMVISNFGNYIMPMGGADYNSGFGLLIYSDGRVRSFSKNINSSLSASGITLGTPVNIKYGYGSVGMYVKINDVIVSQNLNHNQSGSITHTLELAQNNNLSHSGNYAIQKAKLTVGSSVVFDCDFNGSTSIRHGDTKFQASVGGPVTINQSGNDPATVIKKSVLRFDGANTALGGLLNQTIDSGYFFAAFSVLGNGGEPSGRIFGINSTGAFDYNGTGFLVSGHNGNTNDIDSYYGNVGWRPQHDGMFDDANGDILHELKFQAGEQRSRANNADERNRTDTMDQISSEEFKIGALTLAGQDAVAIDLEYLALFPASITDAQADSVRNYINNRNNVFDLKDGFGYYFFDPQIFPIVDPAAFVSFWGGNIVGSDNTLNASVSQSTVNDQPTRDGYKVTFNDNADHLVVASPLSGGQAGWQIVGTSLGTFAYRVNANAVTELNLLGNAGTTRRVGESFGMLLLPESATGADIEAARKLLIDRGAADSVVSGSYGSVWNNRTDIVEFRHSSFQNALNLIKAFKGQTALTSFSAIHAEICTNFSQTWQNCTSLQQFPSGAKLGTSASNVNFADAWRDSGLQSFPALDLSKGINLTRGWFFTPLSSFGAIDASNSTNFSSAWQGTALLTSFPADAKLGTEANNVNFESAWQSSGLTSFSTPLPTASRLFRTWQSCTTLTSFSSDLSLATNAFAAWRICTSLTSFNAALPLATDLRFAFDGCSSLPSFDVSLPVAVTMDSTWLNCSSLTDFSEDVFANWNPSSLASGVFNNAWDGCVNLTAQSVENILTAIDASGKYGTATGAAGGGAIDSGIDIDYNGDTLSAATNTAVTSLKAKGWSIIVNNVTL
jgi:hypothetical protein